VVADQEEPELADACGLDAVRALRVVLDPPGLDRGPRLLQRREPVLVEALVPELPVEALGEGVVGRIAEP
jgi:hypothetical protein